MKALSNRIEGLQTADELLTDESVIGGETDDLSASDIEPPAQLNNQALQGLITEARAHSIGNQGDPKLAALIQHINGLIKGKTFIL